MTERIPLDNLTSDQLDQLYDDLDQAEANLARYAEAESADAAAGSYALRAERVEAQLDRVREVLPFAEQVIATTGIGPASAVQAVLDRLRAALAGPNNQRTTPDNPATSNDPHIYLSTGCYHGDHAYCQSMTGLAGAKRPASCKKCGAKCICPCHRSAPAVSECGPACADQHAYDWTCALFAGVDDSDPADLTGYLAPDPPIGCLNLAAEPTPSQRPGLRNDIARAIHRYDHEHALSGNDLPSKHHRGEADAVLTLLYREWPWLRAAAEDRDQSAATLAAITAEAARRGVVSIDGIRNIVKGTRASGRPPVTS